MLGDSDFTDERVDQLFRLIYSGRAPSVIGSLAAMVRHRPDCEERVVTTIRRAIVGRNRDEINGAVTAIDSWLSLPPDTNHPLPSGLVEQVVSAVANRREPQLLNLIWCARRLLNAGALSPDQRASLNEFFRDLFEETKYDAPEWTGARAISLSLIRAECVRLAKNLTDLGIENPAIADWIKVGQTDRLPEVRLALIENDMGTPTR